MAGTLLERELARAGTGRVTFETATQADDADIRRLLREAPMRGRVSISLEREPDYFADAALPGETIETIIARDFGRLVCAGNCSVRRRFVNGASRRVGYLGGLRLSESHGGRFDILRRGYEFFRELQTAEPADFYFTSIAEDNQRARRFLERGLRGMPQYEFISEFSTLLIPTRGSRELYWEPMAPGNERIDLLNKSNARFQLAPCWNEDELRALQSLGLETSDFFAARTKGKISACAALWDQRSFKQTVIRDYAPWLRLARPMVNGVNWIVGGPRLPRPKETLASAFVSHLGFAGGDPEALLDLLAVIRGAAKVKRIELLTLGFAANDPLLEKIRARFRTREYRSRLYLVRWPGIGGAAKDLDGHLLNPDVSFL